MRIAGPEAVHLVADDPRHGVAILETGPLVDPVPAIGHDVGDVLAPVHAGRVLHPDEGLLWTVERPIAPERCRRRALHGIEARILVADDHAIGHTGRGRLVAHLPVDRVRSEEGEIDSVVASRLGRVVHLLGPVLVMATGDEGLVTLEREAVRVRVDVGRVGHVVAVPLEPADEIDVPGPEEHVAIAGVRPIERHLRRALGSNDRVRAVAVVVVEALSVDPIVRVVVVRLVGVHALLVEEGRRAPVLDDEAHVVLIAGRVRQQPEVRAARPVGRDAERVARCPTARDEPGARVRRAGRLRDAGERSALTYEASAEPAVPPDPIDVDGVGLRRVDRDRERQALALVDARR